MLEIPNPDAPDVPEAPEPRTKPGDLWILGRHRLLCGDARHNAAYWRRARFIGLGPSAHSGFGASRFTPPGFGPSLEEMLVEHPDGRRWMRRRMMSAWDVIRSEYESEHVRAFMLWQAFQTLVPVDSAGSGPLAYSIVFGRQ